MALKHLDGDRPGGGATACEVRLLPDQIDAPMASRLISATMRLDDSVTQDVLRSTRELRPIQTGVFEDLADFLRECSVKAEDFSNYGRIILPPRTGKTVIAGYLIARTGLTTTFITNTLTLVEQACRSLREQLPQVLVGRFTGEYEEVVPFGVNVTTYEMMNRRHRAGCVPPAIAGSGLVIADEAHHAMTQFRLDYLKCAFDPMAVRLALTATPNYDACRALARFFPALVHELSLQEAIGMELLAPLRVWVAEVDADGSVIQIEKGDYQEETLGRLMSGAPFFKAVEDFRYNEENRRTPALITCASRQQAYDLVKYLQTHRPRIAPAPALILGETPGRERLLECFEKDVIDTLVSVNVLVEGWDSPHCKLLIDLAPSVSMVKSTQKFCRVLTRDGDSEARIFMIVPRDLVKPPIMPMELLAPDLEEYEAGDLLGAKPTSHGHYEVHKLERHPRAHPVKEVELKSRILLVHRVEKPLLDRKDDAQARTVLMSHPEYDPRQPLSFNRFRNLLFRHELFTGRADHLMRHLGYRPVSAMYLKMLSRLFPEGAANLLLADRCCHDDCEHDRLAVREATASGPPSNENECERFREMWFALGERPDGEDGLEEVVDLVRQIRRVREILAQEQDEDLELWIVRLRYGFEEGEEHSCQNIADNILMTSPHRVQTLHNQGLEMIRRDLLDY